MNHNSSDAEFVGRQPVTGLGPQEKLLIGRWNVEEGMVAEDNVCLRILELVKSYLTKVATDASGWDVLFAFLISKTGPGAMKQAPVAVQRSAMLHALFHDSQNAKWLAELPLKTCLEVSRKVRQIVREMRARNMELLRTRRRSGRVR